MNAAKRTIAATELILILPAAFFLIAVFARQILPVQFPTAHTADLIVTWYARRQWTLWLLLVTLPFAALLIGGLSLLQGWRQSENQNQQTGRRTDAMLFAATPTAAAALILAVVALHVLAN